jgi:hypothetical protein
MEFVFEENYQNLQLNDKLALFPVHPQQLRHSSHNVTYNTSAAKSVTFANIS